MSETELLDIRSDYIFKLIFGSEEHKNISIAFLNAVLKGKPKIQDIEFRNTEIPKLWEENRTVRLDVKAKIGEHHYADIEMQCRNTHDIIERGIQYASETNNETSKVIQRIDSDDKQLIKENNEFRSYKYPKIISIWILGEKINKRQCAVNEVQMTFQPTELDGFEVASDKIRVITIELPKFNPKTQKRKNQLDAWIAFFKNPLNFEAQKVKEIREAFEVLKEVSANNAVREMYRLRRETEMGYISERTLAIQQAVEEERAKAEAEKKELKAEAEKEKQKAEAEKIETAKKFLAMGLTVDQVAQGTGLSIKSIKELQ